MGNKMNIEKNITSIKILFFGLSTLLVLLVASGSIFLTNNIYFTKEYAQININYLSNKIDFVKSNDNLITGFLATEGTKDYNYDEKAKAIPVLLYHGIVNQPDNANVLVSEFKNQMFTLKKDGWQTITIDEFNEFMKGEIELPKKSFLLTFDDGRKDSYYPVDPILKTLDYKAVMFIITKYSLEKYSGNYYLSLDEIKQMSNSGRWDIQAHTKEGHELIIIDSNGTKAPYYTAKIYLENGGRIETNEEYQVRIDTDMVDAKRDIEAELGNNVIGFAYPFGEFGQNETNFNDAKLVIHDIVQQIYPLAFYQVWGDYQFNIPNSNTLLIKRIEITPDFTANDLLNTLESGNLKNIPFNDIFEKNNGWIKRWGEFNIKDNTLLIRTSEKSTGALVFLDGTEEWENYKFTARINTVKGESVTLVSNYKNELNYDSCIFTTKNIRIEQVIDGHRKTLTKKIGDSQFIGTVRDLSLSTKDNGIACYLDSKLIIKAKVTDKSNKGGIGLKIWDPIENNSEIKVKNIIVESM